MLPRWSDADAMLATATTAAMHGKLHLDVGRCLDRVDLQVRDMLRRRIPRMQLCATDDCRQRLRNGTDHSVRRQFDDEHNPAADDLYRAMLLVLGWVCVDVRQDGLHRVCVS